MLLKVNQIGTISEAFDMVRLAYRHGYGVMPCSSRGEGADIADYTVGLNCGVVRECATGPRGNRFLQIEAELGRARRVSRTRRPAGDRSPVMRRGSAIWRFPANGPPSPGWAIFTHSGTDVERQARERRVGLEPR